MDGILRAWGRILAGYRPNLSVELTRECPLRCAGCYAYSADHLGRNRTLREVHDLQGDALIEGVLAVVTRHRPVHVSLIGGEPLVRHRELDVLLPKLAATGLYTQLVTSAVRPIPVRWASLPRVQVVVSVDGLAPEHDARRAPATYDRVLRHIAGHQVTVHCTITRQQLRRDGYLEEYVRFWSASPDTRQIWFSLYTPQLGEHSAECLTRDGRSRVVAELLDLRARYPRLRMPRGMIEAYQSPPSSPASCVFARTSTCLSADLSRTITPCQLGGEPDCARCGCAAAAGFNALARHRLVGGLTPGMLFEASARVGAAASWVRQTLDS